MSSFKAFLAESEYGNMSGFGTGSMPTSQFGGETRFGFWGLPTGDPHMAMRHLTPVGGYQNYPQYVQHQINKKRMADPNYLILMDLNQLAIYAENAAANIEATLNYGRGTSTKWQTAYVDTEKRMITGLSKEDITGGDYPSLRGEVVARCKHLNIFKPSNVRSTPTKSHPQPAQLVDMDINALSEALEKYRDLVAQTERGYEWQNWRAGKIQSGISGIANAATAPGAVQLAPAIS